MWFGYFRRTPVYRLQKPGMDNFLIYHYSISSHFHHSRLFLPRCIRSKRSEVIRRSPNPSVHYHRKMLMPSLDLPQPERAVSVRLCVVVLTVRPASLRLCQNLTEGQFLLASRTTHFFPQLE